MQRRKNNEDWTYTFTIDYRKTSLKKGAALGEHSGQTSTEMDDCNSSPVDSVIHPIPDQMFYLCGGHKKQLKEEFGIEPWTFEQQVGEAVFIPVGCSHQVRNRQTDGWGYSHSHVLFPDEVLFQILDTFSTRTKYFIKKHLEHTSYGFRQKLYMARAQLGLWEEAAKDLCMASHLDFDEKTVVMLRKVGNLGRS